MKTRIPQAPEAELAVLGAVMLRNNAFDFEGVSDLQPDDFDVPKHRVVWEAIRTLLHGGHPVDIVTLEQQIRASNRLGLVGGLEGLGQLVDRYATSHNISEHARIVAAMARARRAQQGLFEVVQKLGESAPGDVDATIAEALGKLAGIDAGDAEDLSTFSDATEAALRHAKERKNNRRGLLFPWGIKALDHIYEGGLQRGRLNVIAARPGMGKTVLGMQVAFESSKRGETPLVFSIEMLDEQLGQRAITSLGAVDMKAVKEPKTERDWLKMSEAQEFFRRHDGDLWTKSIHLDRLLSFVHRWARRTSKPGPIVIDYLQLLDVRGRGRLDEKSQIKEITRDLKALAKAVELPIVLLSQLNRDCEKRENKRPRLSDLKASGSTEEDADTIVFLYRPRAYDANADPLAAEAIVAKCRDGVPGTAELRFEGHFSRFLDKGTAERRAPGMEWHGQ